MSYELLRRLLDGCNSHGHLLAELEDLASHSRTTELWVDNVLNHRLILMLFVWAEREADWPLHLWCVVEMLL